MANLYSRLQFRRRLCHALNSKKSEEGKERGTWGLRTRLMTSGHREPLNHHGSLTGFVLVIFTILISMTPLVRDRTWKNLEALDINIKYCIVDRYIFPCYRKSGPAAEGVLHQR
ncbi:hypothetical protein ASPTUDRAFT_719699 [Aspergillus tubingensis CBS 134.48]|uniref:Uncharacterized protein n=1 Tax=Aspergillus tubingensis (strain CBS 134.48) TaxID=767770 RepID=A0A1L9N299_ASPTC|nr:hypothetical protein ASPTUDRAFT_719699 [Aspergillus tubingensis CBS 134.48]